jgi:dipeptidyl aminopeptidase/acylaminoacyl peptidase
MPRALLPVHILLVLSLISIAGRAAAQGKPPAPLVSPDVHSDGSVTFRLRAPNAKEVKLDREGADPMLLTPDALNIRSAATCGDGRHIVFESLRSNIWRMDADGSNQTQLTSGDGESFPDCSPDGKWVVYQSLDKSDGFTLWRIPVEGGIPVRLTHRWAYKPRISPGGRFVSYLALASQTVPHDALIVVDSTSGKEMYSWDLPFFTDDYRWAPDGEAVDYIATRANVSNLWRQPLTGGLPKQITSFKSGRMFSFSWSPDGKQLLAVRGDTSNDVILIGNFR